MGGGSGGLKYKDVGYVSGRKFKVKSVLNFIFSKENDSNFAFGKYIPSLKNMWRYLRFVLSNNFAILASGEKFILKNISTEEESEEIDEFHDSQKFLGESSSKKLFKKKKIFHGFCMFFKFKRSILRFFKILF